MKLMKLHAFLTSVALVLGLAGCNGALPTEPVPAPAAPAPAAQTPPPAKRGEAGRGAPGTGAPEKASPGSGPLRAGVALDAIKPAGLEQRSLDVDPFRAEARFVFGTGDKRSVHLSVRVLESAESARAHVSAVAATIVRKSLPAAEAGLPWPGVAQVDKGLLGFAAVSVDNVTGVVRLEGSLDEATDKAVRATLAAFVEAVGEPVAELPRPKVISFAPAGAVRAEKANVVGLEVDAKCDFVAFQATNGASVLRSAEGPMLYAGEAGVVTIKVAVATRRLLGATKETQVEVLAAE